MKSVIYWVAMLGIVALPMVGGLACSKEEGTPEKPGDTTVKNPVATAPKDIVDTAVEAGSFKTLATALTVAGLVETLKGEGPFTVFAPTDDAFAKLPAGTLDDLLKTENKAKLSAILTYHVVPGKVMAKDVVGLSSAKTVNGKALSIAVKDGKVTVDSATVIKADIQCSNGVIHVIDAVMLPPTE